MSKLIQWNPQYSVGIKHLDEEHKQLVDTLNELHAAMRSGKANSVMGPILDSLISYAATHFESEEKLFKEYDYPHFDSHKKEHEDFKEKVLEFKNEFDEGRIMLSIQVINFLKNWLIKHILASDKEYSAYLNAKGVN